MSSIIIPCLRYRDAPRMIEWLCDTFGFERNLAVDDGMGGISHVHLNGHIRANTRASFGGSYGAREYLA